MKTDNYADIFTNTQQKTAPQALFATIEAAKRGQVGKSEIEKAASEFESVFLGQMLQSMVPSDKDPNSLFGNEEGDEIFQTMMVDEYAKQISKSGGIGIASYVQRELLGQQEVSNNTHSRNYKLGMFKMDADAEHTEAVSTASDLIAENTNERSTKAEPTLSAMNDADAVVNEIFNGGY